MNKVLVTGANKGIGFQIAKALGLQGWSVLVGARNAERAAQAVAQLKKDGVQSVSFVLLDLLSIPTLDAAVETIRTQHPDVNLLVNNAGIPGNMAVPSYESDIKDIQETVQVNYVGTFYLTKLMVPVIAANKGRIVNITVPHSVNPYWNPLAYVASKAAQNTMTSIMAFEFDKNKVPVQTYSIHPGPTTTDLNGNMSAPGFHTADVIGQKVAQIIADGQNHQGQFIELYPIVEE